MRTAGEAYLTGVDDVEAQRYLMESTAARESIVTDADRDAPETPEAARFLTPPVSIYTALASAGHGRLLTLVEENPPLGGAIRKLVTGAFHFAFRAGKPIADVVVGNGHYLSDLDAFAADLSFAEAAEPKRENYAAAPTDPWEAVCAHNARLATATGATGVAETAVALCVALEAYAVRYGHPLGRVGVPNASFSPRGNSAGTWVGRFGRLVGD